MDKRLIKYLEKVNRKLEQGEHVSVEFKCEYGIFNLPLENMRFRSDLITLNGQAFYLDIDDSFKFIYADCDCTEPKLIGEHDIKIGFKQENNYIPEHE